MSIAKAFDETSIITPDADKTAPESVIFKFAEDARSAPDSSKLTEGACGDASIIITTADAAEAAADSSKPIAKSLGASSNNITPADKEAGCPRVFLAQCYLTVVLAFVAHKLVIYFPGPHATTLAVALITFFSALITFLPPMLGILRQTPAAQVRPPATSRAHGRGRALARPRAHRTHGRRARLRGRLGGPTLPRDARRAAQGGGGLVEPRRAASLPA
jgi:hypothetical protein